MCVIAVHDGGKPLIDRDEWDDAWWENPHGGGIATMLSTGEIRVVKSMERRNLRKSYERMVKDADFVIVHFRIATHGSTALHNVHPFRVPGHDAVIAHNGILTQLISSLKKDESDTRAFVRVVLRDLPKEWPQNPALIELVTHYLRGDRLAVMTPHTKRKVHLFGGTWYTDKAGVSWSNQLHKRPSFPVGQRHKIDTRYAGWWGVDEWDDPEDPIDDPGDALFPDGIPWDNTDDDELVEVIADAIDAGYCGTCLWRPCRCGEVCLSCSVPLEKDCPCLS